MKKISKPLFSLLYIICLAAFCLTGVLLAGQVISERRGTDFYDELTRRDLNETAAETAVTPASEPSNPQPQFQLCERIAVLSEELPDAVLWLQIPETTVDYPVMFCEDNTFYLDHLPDGTENALGSLFLDCRTIHNSSNLIIYGHNGSRQRMFGLLKQYEDPAFQKEHPRFFLATKEAVYTCSIFSVETVDLESPIFETDFRIQDDPRRIVTLSTCISWQPNKRLVVQAFLEDS